MMWARILFHPLAFLRGWRESSGELGMTYGSPDSGRSIAYDLGRDMGRRGEP